MTTTEAVLSEVHSERVAQDAEWGQQDHPNGTGSELGQRHADYARNICEAAFARGEGTWAEILLEEVYEALAESDPARLRAELVQVAAVAVAWVEKIDRDAATTDGRECGFMGCGHPRCAETCTAVPLAEWREWKRN